MITGSGHNEMDEHGTCKLAVMKVLRNGKRLYDPAAKERLIDACLVPGVSVAGLALEHGVNANLLRNWIGLRRRRARQEQPIGTSDEPPAFIPVIEAASGSAGSAGGRALAIGCERHVARVRPTTRSQPQARVTAALPNGVTVTLDCGDAQIVSAMIEALGRYDVPAGA
jgi:transposase